MPSTYSSRLRLELIADGEQAGIWGQSTNRNLGTLIETAIAGYRTIALLDANYTLTASNGLDDEARYAMLNFTGTLTAAREVVVPAVSKLYVLKNQTNQTLNVKTSGGSARAVPAGKTVYLFVDGTNTFDSLNDLTSLSVSGTTTLGVASATNLSYTGTLTGGTGVINIGSGQIVKDAAGNITLSGPVFAQATGGAASVARFGSTLSSGRAATISLGNNAGVSRATIALNAGTEEMIVGSEGNFPVHIQTNGATRLTVDGVGNAGLGITPSAWGSAYRSLDIRSGGAGFAGAGAQAFMSANAYNDNTNWVYKTTNFASLYRQDAVGNHQWNTAPSGTAGNPITFTQAMTLFQAGQLSLGRTDVQGKLTVETANASETAGYFRNSVSDGVIQLNSNTAASRIKTLSGGGLTFGTDNSAGDSEGFRLTSTRYLKVSNTGSYGGTAGIASQATSASHIIQSNDAINTLSIINGNTGGSVRCVTTALATGAAGLHYDALLNAVTVYQVLANGDVRNTNNSYGAISDAKLKENIADAPSYLQKFMQVRFRKYNMIGSDLVQFGVVAQELETVFPGLVDTTPDFEQVEVLDQEKGQTRTESVALGTVTKSVKYSVLAAMQGKVIQEQQQIIQAQQAQIESILTRLAALEGRRNG